MGLPTLGAAPDRHATSVFVLESQTPTMLRTDEGEVGVRPGCESFAPLAAGNAILFLQTIVGGGMYRCRFHDTQKVANVMPRRALSHEPYDGHKRRSLRPRCTRRSRTVNLCARRHMRKLSRFWGYLGSLRGQEQRRRSRRSGRRVATRQAAGARRRCAPDSTRTTRCLGRTERPQRRRCSGEGRAKEAKPSPKRSVSLPNPRRRKSSARRRMDPTFSVKPW